MRLPQSIGGSSSVRTAVLPDASQAKRTAAKEEWVNISLNDDPKPSARTGVSRKLQEFGSAVGGAFTSLKGKLSVAKDNVLDLAGKAKHGLASTGRTLSREASALVGQFSAPSRSAQSRAATPAAASVPAVPAQPLPYDFKEGDEMVELN